MAEDMRAKMEECHLIIKEIEMNLEKLRADNLKLREENDELRKENEKLLKMVMKTDDAISLPNVYHRAFFGIMEILSMDKVNDEDKLDYLKIYLRPSLEENARCVLSCIASIKEEHEEYSSILEDFHQWIINTFAY